MNKTAIFWIIITGLCISALISISEVLTPFFVAFILSYLLQPAVNVICAQYKLPREKVVLLIFIIFLGIFLTAIIILLPIVYQQISGLISNVPKYNHYFQSEIMPIIASKFHALEPNIAAKIKDSLSSFINNIFFLLSGTANNFWHYTRATINVMILIFLIPVILFYFLRDWPEMKKNTELLLPLKGKDTIKEIFSKINNLLSAYIRGQLNICLFLALFYSVSLSIVGIDFALLLGILSGFLVIIPFVGTLISLSLTMIIGYIVFGMKIKLLYILLIYLVGNTVESYILTPKIIGNKIGLHPVWIIFAVFACGSLFGFVGIFFAIPIAGITKILFLSLIDYYKTSQFYKS